MIFTQTRRKREGLLHFAARSFSRRYPRAFNAICESLCNSFGHCYERDVYSIDSARREYRHFCPCCCTYSQYLAERNAFLWREAHGISCKPSAYPRLRQTWVRAKYAWATFLGKRPNMNDSKRVYDVSPF